jgi:HAD superfamily hydrolase (TIGR01509 family)
MTSTTSADATVQASHPAILFDLDGTLIDSVYQHVAAWHEALLQSGIAVSVWKLHRRIGMSGGLFLHALQREIGREISAEQQATMTRLHAEGYARRLSEVTPLPGARDLLHYLAERSVPFAIATSGAGQTAARSVELLDLQVDVPVVTRDQVERAKPDPHLFLAAAQILGVSALNCFVVGDSVWDLLAAQRARALSVGVLSGGYGREELQACGAYRVYADVLEMLDRIEEIGVRPAL